MTENLTLTYGNAVAVFKADQGLQLISFQKEGHECIDPNKPFFIGPHFSLRKHSYPFGVGRFAPWNVQMEGGKLIAALSGKDEWKGAPVADAEGQQFKLQASAFFVEDSLHFHTSVVSDTDSAVGGLFPLMLPSSSGTLEIDSKNHYYCEGRYVPIQESWTRSESGTIIVPLDESINGGFHPYFNPIKGSIILNVNHLKVEVGFSCHSQESAMVVQYEKGAPSISIGAVSSQNPWKPNLTVSSIDLSLKLISY